MRGMERRRALLAELRSYTGLSAADEGRLAAFRTVAEPHFAAVADEFYAVIRMHPGAFAVLKDEAQARRLHASLQVWLGELLGGPHDDAWVQRHARIGEVHVRVGLELRYMVTAMSRVRVSLQRVAADADADPSGELRQAIARVCDLDLAIMLESYNDHLLGRVERARTREEDAAREQVDRRERVLREALVVADVAALVFNPDGRLLLANRRAEELTGYAQDELLDVDVFAVLFGAQAATMRATLLASDTPVELEAEVQTRAGKTRLVRWRASGRGADGESATPASVLVGMERHRAARARASGPPERAARGRRRARSRPRPRDPQPAERRQSPSVGPRSRARTHAGRPPRRARGNRRAAGRDPPPRRAGQRLPRRGASEAARARRL